MDAKRNKYMPLIVSVQEVSTFFVESYNNMDWLNDMDWCKTGPQLVIYTTLWFGKLLDEEVIGSALEGSRHGLVGFFIILPAILFY